MRTALLAAFVICFATSASAATTYFRLVDEISEETVTPLIEALDNDDLPRGRNDAVVIEINSPGGEVDAGFKLVKAIERYPAHVICVVDGEADSMASYVFVSCDVRVMTRRSVVMIHQPAVGTDGRAQLNEWQNIVDWLTASQAAMFEHYAFRMRGITALELASRCAGGRAFWMDWRSAQKYGAVDIVVDRVADLTRVGAW